MGKVSGQANDSTVEILYQLGITQDPGTSKRFVDIFNKDEKNLNFFILCSSKGSFTFKYLMMYKG